MNTGKGEKVKKNKSEICSEKNYNPFKLEDWMTVGVRVQIT